MVYKYQKIDFILLGLREDATYYDVLGVSPYASKEEIKKSYRRLAKLYRMDESVVNEVNIAKYKEVYNAYEIISNEETRAKYNQYLILTRGYLTKEVKQTIKTEDISIILKKIYDELKAKSLDKNLIKKMLIEYVIKFNIRKKYPHYTDQQLDVEYKYAKEKCIPYINMRERELVNNIIEDKKVINNNIKNIIKKFKINKDGVIAYFTKRTRNKRYVKV